MKLGKIIVVYFILGRGLGQSCNQGDLIDLG